MTAAETSDASGPSDELTGHGGELGLAALCRAGVEELFTLNGAHVWPFYDAARNQDVPIYDTRHEQSAAFAAEGVAKLTGRPGVAVLTAGPGVTNGISAVAGARQSGSPLVVLGGRAPHGRWGAGSLQEFDHVPLLEPITKAARTITETAEMGVACAEAAALAASAHRGPVFLDFPMDALFSPATGEVPLVVPTRVEPDPDDVTAAGRLLTDAVRPAIIAGSDVHLEGAAPQLRALVESQRVPVFANGLGRGCVPADHELAFSRTRGMLKTDADLVIVVGTPLDFRLSFGSFGAAQVIHIVDHPDQRAAHATTAASPAGDLNAVLSALAEGPGPADRSGREAWIESLRDAESAARAADAPALAASDGPIKPSRVFGELRAVLDRDAVVVCDGGDFASYAGKYLDVQEAGCWLDPGPFGCLGTGMGYTMAARVVHPDRQVIALLGDGAAGFSLMDVDSLVRLGLPAVLVCGNNGIWGLEKHPMRMIYGYDLACDLQPECRYDTVVEALGGAGETVRDPDEIGPALRRAFDAGVPYLVNVVTDPDDAYPRTSNLA